MKEIKKNESYIQQEEKVKNLQTTKKVLSGYHGATQLQNIPEFTSSALYQELMQKKIVSLALDQTVTKALEQIVEALTLESMMLQFGRRQQQLAMGNILRSQKAPENQRLDFLKSTNVSEMLELIFTPPEYGYATVNPLKFISKLRAAEKRMPESERAEHNKGLNHKAIDAVPIDPDRVPETSLETLGIELDPDCQNLKEIFKKMRPLCYPDGSDKKYSIRINEYKGKYIVLSGQKIVFPVSEPATQGEKRKADAKGQMSVHPDIFSIIRRKEHIMDYTGTKKEEYKKIKQTLLSSIKMIDRNKKEYSVRVQQNVKEIIDQIKGATNAKVAAQNIYHLYKIAGKHCIHDKQHLEASMKAFTQRIAELIGISGRTQLHLLELNDAYEDQKMNLEMFHAQIGMNKPLLALENYYCNQRFQLQEPFLTFDKQIKKICGPTLLDARKNINQSALIIETVALLQRECLTGYILQHELNLEEKTIEQVAEELKHIKPGFRTDMTKRERDLYFAQFKNLSALDKEIDEMMKS